MVWRGKYTKGLRVILIIIAVLMFSALATASQIIPFQLSSLMSFPTSMTAFEPINLSSSGSVSSSPTAIPSDTVTNLQSTQTGQNSWTDPRNNKWIHHPFVSTAPPNPVSDAYFNASSITQAQENEALNIASTSDIYKEYMQYPNSGWTYTWTYPYTGAIHLSTTISPNNPSATVYGLLSFDVDINDGRVLNGGFTDWHNTW